MKIESGFGNEMREISSVISGHKSGGKFKERLFETVRQGGGISDLSSATEAMLRKSALEPRDFLKMQLAVGQYNLRVELASKLTETLASTPRRLQQG